MSPKEKFPSLFKSDSDWHNNARLNFLIDMSHSYIHGYKLAADELVIKINETGSNQDYLIYPIVFLYRQHLELMLKSIIKSSRKLLRTEEQGHPTHHRIKDLWPLAKGLRKKIWQEDHPSEFKLIDHVVTEFSDYDQDSMAFRYPEDKNGAKPNRTLKHINTRHLAETIAKVSSLLSEIEIGIDYYMELKNEMYSD